jgi:Zn-dependent metalloprotease
MDYPKIRSSQQELLKRLQTIGAKLQFRWDENRGALSFARSDDLAPGQARIEVESDTSRNDGIMRFLSEYGELFGLQGKAAGLGLLSARKDYLGIYHHEYQQFAETNLEGGAPFSVEVYGSRLVAHFAPDGRFIEIQSSCHLDVQPTNAVKIDIDWLRKRVQESIRSLEGFGSLEKRLAARERFFPLAQEPRLVIYPGRGQPIYSWAAHGYGALQTMRPASGKPTRRTIAFAQMFFNAESGELFLFAPMSSWAETPDVGSGLSSLPLDGPFADRILQIIRIDNTNTYLLKDATRGRSIVTYNANASPLSTQPADAILFRYISVSVNRGPSWNRTAADSSNEERTASQQPEVDAHATCGDVYDWYAAIGYRAGWDNDLCPPSVAVDPTINVVAHAVDPDPRLRQATSRSVNLGFVLSMIGNTWYGSIVCFDGDPTGTTEAGVVYGYPAGSKALIAHEYQHGVTNFSVLDGAGNPGGVPRSSETAPDGTQLAGWGGAIQEGLSDVFAGLITGDWWMGREISPDGRIWRNLAFPRDATALSSSKADHWDDRDFDAATGTPDGGYFRGCILAHAAYLMAVGGIHQRYVRSPTFIPVRGIGQDQGVYNAAHVWYRLVSEYLKTIGAFNRDSTDEEKFHRIRDNCVSSVIDLFQFGSREHKTVVLAWYAVGLHQVGTNYGADLTFITWPADWPWSRPYIGVGRPDWSDSSAPDLFINNGSRSEWKALINVNAGGAPTTFENNVFVRVRNIGDQLANDCEVRFEYTKVLPGGAIVGWQPVLDKDDNIQRLSIGLLDAGQSNFPDTAQDGPPSSACIKWCIPPLLAGEQVDHFRLRATVASDDDVNEFNNDVQSNISYSTFVPGVSV